MDKAVILARGLGTRMRREDPGAALTPGQEEVALSGVKALMPVGRPFLDYQLSALAEAGYRRVCLVIGPEHEMLRRYCRETLECDRLSLETAVQEQARGTADAVAAAEGFCGGDPFLAINSDNHYPVEALRDLRGLEGPGLAAFERESMVRLGNIPAARVTQYAAVETGAQGELRRIVEKPDEELLNSLPQPVGVSMNCWCFDAAIFAACRAISPSPRGELEITDAVQWAVDRMGVRFQVLLCRDAVLDLSGRGDVGPVKERLAGVEVRL